MSKQTVVLGGNVADISGALIPSAREELNSRVLQAEWSDPEIHVAEHSERLATTGAAYHVLQRLVDNPMAWTN